MVGVYILYHVHEFDVDDGRDDEIKIIGIYESLTAAEFAQQRAEVRKGFSETKEDF